MLKALAATPTLALGCSGSSGGGFDAATRFDAGFVDSGMDAGGPDALPDAAVCTPTTSDATGPFFEEGAPVRTMLATLDEPGERLLIEGRVLSATSCSAALGGYTLDIWQADAEGEYHSGADFRLRGKVVTDAEGRFSFETIRPGNYPLGGSFRPAHLHLRAYDELGTERLTTQIYFEGDRFLFPEDPCGPPGCRSDDPDRIVRLDPAMVSGRAGVAGVLPLFL